LEPIILHIETSSRLCSVALSTRDLVTASASSSEINDHSASLAPMIHELLNSRHIKPTDLSAVAVSIGPGSYTGLRVGLSTCKSICFAAGRPLIAVDTLQSLAWVARTRLAGNPHNIYVSVLDARREDAYLGVFSHDGTRLEADGFLTVSDDCLDRFVSNGREIVICGEGTAKWTAFQGRKGFRILAIDCKAENLVGKALLAFQNGEFEELSDCVPKYLKPPHITIST